MTISKWERKGAEMFYVQKLCVGLSCDQTDGPESICPLAASFLWCNFADALSLAQTFWGLTRVPWRWAKWSFIESAGEGRNRCCQRDKGYIVFTAEKKAKDRCSFK